MHKYQPRIHLVKRNNESMTGHSVMDLEAEEYKTFVYPETTFTAVTAYQNQLVSSKYEISLKCTKSADAMFLYFFEFDIIIT